MTQLEAAKKGIITPEMKKVASDEKIAIDILKNNIRKGYTVIPKNINHAFKNIKGIGKNLSTKINANIGTSSDIISIDKELNKLKIAVASGTDSVMDLSTGGDLNKIREIMLAESDVMLGSVPIYALAAKLAKNDIPTSKMDTDELFKEIEKQCEQGTDYITVHCGITKNTLNSLNRSERIMGIVSRGGSILADWIRVNNKENPLYEFFDDLLAIAYKYDVTLSLGDGLRPGAISDATDTAQIDELITLGKLAKRAWDKNVQVIIEGPGHVPINDIEKNIILQKEICSGAPFYILGPLPTDIAPGYDHITSAIGGAIAGAAGADFICYVTPAEHLCLPDEKDVKEGVIAAKIAAHIADIAKNVPGAIQKDIQMSKYRRSLDWEGMFSLAIDPERAKKRLQKNMDIDSCSMCGKLCAVKIDKN